MEVINSPHYHKTMSYGEGIALLSSRGIGLPVLNPIPTRDVVLASQTKTPFWDTELRGVIFTQDDLGTIYVGISNITPSEAKNFSDTNRVNVDLTFFLGDRQPIDHLDKRLRGMGFEPKR